jgi:hypothetical protein
MSTPDVSAAACAKRSQWTEWVGWVVVAGVVHYAGFTTTETLLALIACALINKFGLGGK